MDNIRGGPSKENNLKQFIGAAHEIVELIENKGEVSTLKQEIVIQKTNLETLKISRENLQNLIGENAIQIENSEGVSKALNDYYIKFTSEARVIYDHALKSFNGVEYEEKMLEKLSEIDKKNKNKLAILNAMFDNQEKRLLKESEKAAINNRKAQEERNKIDVENIKLKQELSEIETEICVFEKEKSALEKEIAQYNNVDVCHLKEDIIRADNEILDLSKKLKATEEEKQKEESIVLKSFEEANEKLIEIENILIEKTIELQNDLTENDEITELEILNEQAEKKMETLITQCKELDKNNEEYERKFNDEIENYQENLKKSELHLKSEKEVHEKLTTDEETLKMNLKSAEADVESLKIVIHELELEPIQDVNNELEVKEQIAKNLKLKHETLNAEYTRRLAEKQGEIEQDILKIETDNNKAESSIKIMEDEIKEMEKEKEELEKKRLDLEKILQELTKEAAPVLPQKKIRHWDSDTTIEDEDTSYADKVLMKIKKMNAKK